MLSLKQENVKKDLRTSTGHSPLTTMVESKVFTDENKIAVRHVGNQLNGEMTTALIAIDQNGNVRSLQYPSTPDEINVTVQDIGGHSAYAHPLKNKRFVIVDSSAPHVNDDTASYISEASCSTINDESSADDITYANPVISRPIFSLSLCETCLGKHKDELYLPNCSHHY